VFEIKRRLRVLLTSPDSDDVFVLIDNHVFFYSAIFTTVYLTIILRGRAGYEMIDNQRGA